MIDRLPVTDQDLSDLIDGRLGPEREQDVRRALEQRPELAEVYGRMIEQDRMLRRLGVEMLAEPVPAAMLAVLRDAEDSRDRRPAAGASVEEERRPDVPRRTFAIASALALTLGLVLGWLGHLVFGPSDAGLFRDAVSQAAISHRLFEETGEHQPIADLGTSDTLPVAGVPRLFGTPVRAPVLTGSGWVPVGLKTESGTGGNAMQIAYADRDGTTVTLFIRPLSDADDVPVNRVEAEGYDVLYWVDGPLIYALVGNQDEAILVDLARQIYASRASGGAWSLEPGSKVAQPTAAGSRADP